MASFKESFKNGMAKQGGEMAASVVLSAAVVAVGGGTMFVVNKVRERKAKKNVKEVKGTDETTPTQESVELPKEIKEEQEKEP